jgi:site-specific recombinase XerD
MTLNSYFPQFLEWMRAGGASEHTINAYRRALKRLGEVLRPEAQPEALNAFTLQNFIGVLRLEKLADSSIGQALTAAKSFVSWATAEGIYGDNFAKAVRGPRRQPRIPMVPTIGEMKHMLDGEAVPSSWPERDRLVLELLYGCGLRNSELIGLNLEDRIKHDELIIRGKGKKERTVPMGEHAIAALDDYLPGRKAVPMSTGCSRANPEPARWTNDHPQHRAHGETHSPGQGLVLGHSPAFVSPCLRRAHAGKRRPPHRHTETAGTFTPGYHLTLWRGADLEAYERVL